LPGSNSGMPKESRPFETESPPERPLNKKFKLSNMYVKQDQCCT
jgi:hypothetical protein